MSVSAPLQSVQLAFKQIEPFAERMELSIGDGNRICLQGQRSGVRSYSVDDLCGWECHDQHAILNFSRDDCSTTTVLRGNRANVDRLRRLLHHCRTSTYLEGLSESDRGCLQSISCPACGLETLSDSAVQSPVGYCPECHAMWDANGELTKVKGEPFNFCSDAFFSQVGKETRRDLWQHALQGRYSFRSLQEEVQPTLDKLAGHSLWCVIWGVLLCLLWYPYLWQWGAWHWMGQLTVVRAVYILLSLLAVHVGFIGYYVTGLVMTRSLSAYFRPSSLERQARLCRKGSCEAAETLTATSGLDQHPGALCNLAAAYAHSGALERSQGLYRQAEDLCPNHPVILRLAATVAVESERQRMEARLHAIEERARL
ncbi:MAG: hypothetical protein KDK78_08005 [Chlamydiia bacterium]|nr:hypothetical protein [Chlamydiia bacterium]